MAAAAPLFGWSAEVHRRMSSTALEVVSSSVVAVTSEERAALLEAAVQPDFMRPQEQLQLRDREAPEHYLDLERLRGQELPATRSEFVKLVARLATSPGLGLNADWTMETVGSVPYAVVELTQRLAVALTLARQRPESRHLRTFAMLWAGSLAHYAQDLCQPLHTTVHFDGRADAEGRSPRSGLHRLVDGLPAASPLDQRALRGLESRPYDDLFGAVEERLLRSHRLVDRVYRLESELRRERHGQAASGSLLAFAEERYREAVSFTADLLHTAWLLSATLEIPGTLPTGQPGADAQP